MNLLKSIFTLFLFFALTSICLAQKTKVALVDTKLFYASENGIVSLVDTMKSVNPNFIDLTAEEKDEEFKRVVKTCPDANNEASKSITVISDAKINAACVVIKDISGSLQKFKEKHNFVLLLNVNICAALGICNDGVDVTKQFIDEYNSAKK